MSGEIVLGIGLFKSALDIVKSLKDANDTATRQGIAIELGGKILAAQEQQTSLVEQINTLKAEVATFETWDADKQCYELKPLGHQGVIAYAVKPEHEGTEPSHWICPDCYQRRKKSILQVIKRFPGGSDVRLCQQCGWEAYVSGFWVPEHAKARGAK